MSCDWDVRCLDCQEDLGIDNANHAVELMRVIITHVKEIAAIDPFLKAADRAGYFIDFSFGSGSYIQTAWFVKHADHRLAPVNEYGQLDGECGAWVSCPECKHDEHCRLPKGHAGDHDFKVK